MSLDQVLTLLPENTDPQETDLLLIVDDPAGAPDTQTITVDTLRASDPNRPSADEKAALVGTNGTPSSSNKYVTASDPLLPTADQKAALAGTSGTPSASNPYVTAADPTLPTTDEKAALVGTNGTPSASNKYVTASDPLLPTSDQKAALAGTNGTPSVINKYVTASEPTLPTSDEKAALAGTNGTPSATNKYVTAASSLAVLATRSASDLTSGTLAPARGGTGAGALTNGSVPFIISSGVFSEDNARLVWNNASKRLGVGTASPTAPLTVNANTSAVVGSGTDTVAQIIQEDGLTASLLVDSFANFPALTWRRANTGVSAKSAVASGDPIGRLRGYGYGSSGYSSGARAIFECVATENWTDTAQGAMWRWFVTDTGGTTTTERLRLHASGGLSLNNTTDPGTGALLATAAIKSSGATGGVGYATGAGGTQTQATSKSTSVTLNTVCGQITMSNAALAASTIVTFTLNNSAIAAGDVLVLNHVSGGTAGAYGLNAQCASGSASINVRNHTPGSLSEAIVIAFAVIKAVTS